jgi:monofunctional biosynthetic peptidoglycan transglycosylase
MGRNRIKKAVKIFAGGLLILPILASCYAAYGYFDARQDAPQLAIRADQLIAQRRGAEGLGRGRIDKLLLVEDPGFWQHSGVDFSTKGQGATTLTQGLGKSVGFAKFKPGIRKLRLMGYAMGLESKLSKSQIIALALDEVEMGRGPTGWMKGFYSASNIIFARSPDQLTDPEFLSLVAVPIAPRNFDLMNGNVALKTRVGRIQRLVQGECEPSGVGDVWLEGCASY